MSIPIRWCDRATPISTWSCHTTCVMWIPIDDAIAPHQFPHRITRHVPCEFPSMMRSHHINFHIAPHDMYHVDFHRWCDRIMSINSVGGRSPAHPRRYAAQGGSVYNYLISTHLYKLFTNYFINCFHRWCDRIISIPIISIPIGDAIASCQFPSYQFPLMMRSHHVNSNSMVRSGHTNFHMVVSHDMCHVDPNR